MHRRSPWRAPEAPGPHRTAARRRGRAACRGGGRHSRQGAAPAPGPLLRRAEPRVAAARGQGTQRCHGNGGFAKRSELDSVGTILWEHDELLKGVCVFERFLASVLAILVILVTTYVG